MCAQARRREEFVRRRDELKLEIESLKETQADLRGKTAWGEEAARNVLNSCKIVCSHFAGGAVYSKQEVAYAQGGPLAPTQGILEIRPDPLLNSFTPTF